MSIDRSILLSAQRPSVDRSMIDPFLSRSLGEQLLVDRSVGRSPALFTELIGRSINRLVAPSDDSKSIAPVS